MLEELKVGMKFRYIYKPKAFNDHFIVGDTYRYLGFRDHGRIIIGNDTRLVWVEDKNHLPMLVLESSFRECFTFA